MSYTAEYLVDYTYQYAALRYIPPRMPRVNHDRQDTCADGCHNDIGENSPMYLLDDNRSEHRSLLHTLELSYDEKNKKRCSALHPRTSE